MNFYAELVVVEQQDAIRIEKYLCEQPNCDDNAMHDPITYTATFNNGKFADVTVHPVDWEEGGDNRPWTECVLFDRNGFGISMTDPDEVFFETWELLYDDDVYRVIVISEDNWILDEGNTIEYLDDGRLLVTKPDGTQVKMY